MLPLGELRSGAYDGRFRPGPRSVPLEAQADWVYHDVLEVEGPPGTRLRSAPSGRRLDCTLVDYTEEGRGDGARLILSRRFRLRRGSGQPSDWGRLQKCIEASSAVLRAAVGFAAR